jgi:hypothetical protein
MNWNQLNLDEKLKTLEDTRKKNQFELFIIEKDGWVVQTLRGDCLLVPFDDWRNIFCLAVCRLSRL